MAQPSLLHLAFGNATARASNDLDAFTAAQWLALPAVTSYEPLTGRTAFRPLSATVCIGDVRLVPIASPPLAMVAGDSRKTMLLIRFRGWEHDHHRRPRAPPADRGQPRIPTQGSPAG